MATPRLTGVIVANRSRPAPQPPLEEIAQSHQQNSPPYEAAHVLNSLTPVMLQAKQSQLLPKSFLHDEVINTLAETLKTVGDDWKKWRGDDGCFLASRRGVLLTLAGNQAGEVVVHKERIAKEVVPSTVINQAHPQLVAEMKSVEQCRGRREETVLPLLRGVYFSKN